MFMAPKPTSEMTRKAFSEVWIKVLLTQQKQIHQEWAFRGVFAEICRDLGVPLVPILADATGVVGEKHG